MVYLLHFSLPYWHAQHYIGFCGYGLTSRLRYHESGRGSRLMKAVYASGRTVVVARRWRGAGRTFERQLKNRGGATELCPICSGRQVYRRAKRP
jgi:hypothetical protein